MLCKQAVLAPCPGGAQALLWQPPPDGL